MADKHTAFSESEGVGLSEADKQIVSDFIDMTQAKMKLRKSPRVVKEIVAKQETSSFSLEDEDAKSVEEVETKPQQSSVGEVVPQQSSTTLPSAASSHFSRL